MYLAPLNYDRFFKKIFSNTWIAQKFLEDFFDIEITEIQPLRFNYKLTDEASVVKFDFRCKVNGKYIVIDMQQWHKQDVVQRFYLYHAANTVLQLESISTEELIFENTEGKKAYPQEKTTKNYKELEPVLTLIWMVHDKLGFTEDYIVYKPLPEGLEPFVREIGGKKLSFEAIQERAKALIKTLDNDTKGLSFLGKNKLIYAFQGNIIKNNKLQKYQRWFEFAEKTRNKMNTPKDFEEYMEDKVFTEVIRKLSREGWEKEDYKFLHYYHTWESKKEVFAEDFKEEGYKKGVKDMEKKVEEANEREKKAKEETEKANEREKKAKEEAEKAKERERKAKEEAEKAKEREKKAKEETEAHQRKMIQTMLEMGYTLEQIEAFGFERTFIQQVKEDSDERK